MAARLKRDIDTLLGRSVEAGEVPGVAAMVCRGGEIVYEGAFGRRVRGQPAPMSTDTVVWIASMTKAITATAAMQLVEQGRLSLDSAASRCVPELASIQVLEGYDAAGRAQLRPPRRPVTLRHLLTHTAGFGYEIWNPLLGRYMEETGIPRVGSGRNAAFRSPLLFDPGERWNYGINIDWVGRIVEVVSGKKLGTYLREHVLEPLDMRDTAFKITPSMRSRLGKIHQRGPDGSLQVTDIEVPQEPEFEMGGGGLYSTAVDYLAFLRMILSGGLGKGNRVLEARTVESMSRNQMGELFVTALHSAIPDRSNDAEFFPEIPKQWGLSFMINNAVAPTGRSAGSLAWAGLSNCYYWIDPAEQIGGVYVTQILPFADRKSLPLFYAFENTVYRSLKKTAEGAG